MEYVNTRIRLASEQECVGCSACVDVCKRDAIQMIKNAEGHVIPIIDDRKCVSCKQCEKLCSKIRANYGNNDLSSSFAYAAWSSNGLYRRNATSGGIFAELADLIIEEGGVVFGAYFDGKNCTHICINTKNEIFKLQGSKYMMSSTLHVYREIEKNLQYGPVLFSGTGCQCSAVINYFEQLKYYDRLYTVDLVCGGIPSSILVDRFFDQNKDINGIIEFRNKDKYEMSVREGNEIKAIKERNLPLHGFSCEMTNRYSCYDCKFAFAHRRSDFTIGDIWNYDVFESEHSKGISMVLAHNIRANNLLKKTNSVLNKVQWKDILISNIRIVTGKTPIFMPRKKLAVNIKVMNSEVFYKLYTMSMTKKDILLECFRVYRFIYIKIHRSICKNRIRRMIRNYESKI